jgi:hypothetical protein
MKEVAFGIEGVENDPNPGEGTVRVYWKQFMAGWQREHAAIPGHITISVTNVCILQRQERSLLWRLTGADRLKIVHPVRAA